MKGEVYWKPLGKTILQYMDHPEHKLGGDVGYLERKYITCNDIQYIGKESNNINEELYKSTMPVLYKNNEEFIKDLSMSNKEIYKKYPKLKSRSHIKYYRDKEKRDSIS